MFCCFRLFAWKDKVKEIKKGSVARKGRVDEPYPNPRLNYVHWFDHNVAVCLNDFKVVNATRIRELHGFSKTLSRKVHTVLFGPYGPL